MSFELFDLSEEAQYKRLNTVLEGICEEYAQCEYRREFIHVYRELRDVLANRDSFICGICHEAIPPYYYPDPESASVDHVIPKSKGGLTVASNLQITHLRCNQSKGNRVKENTLA